MLPLIAALALHAPADAAPRSSPIVDLAGAENAPRCLPDNGPCFAIRLADSAQSGPLLLHIVRSASEGQETQDIALPYEADSPDNIELWPHAIPIPAQGAAMDETQYLIGIVIRETAFYSGGGGSGGRLHLVRLSVGRGGSRLAGEVLDTVWNSSLMIRACFSEEDLRDRLGACHDDYRFAATLAAADNDGGELPALTYRAVATAYPQTARRSEDGSGQRLTRADLSHWRDPECSYVRILRYNPATSRYEMERPAPDCSAYTTP